MCSLEVETYILCLVQYLTHKAEAQTWSELSFFSLLLSNIFGDGNDPCRWTHDLIYLSFLWISKLLVQSFLLETSFFLGFVMRDFLGFRPNTLSAPSHSVVSWSGFISTRGFYPCADNAQIRYPESLLFWSPDSSVQLPPRQVYTQCVEHKCTIFIPPKLLLIHCSLCAHHPPVTYVGSLSHPQFMSKLT